MSVLALRNCQCIFCMLMSWHGFSLWTQPSLTVSLPHIRTEGEPSSTWQTPAPSSISGSLLQPHHSSHCYTTEPYPGSLILLIKEGWWVPRLLLLYINSLMPCRKLKTFIFGCSCRCHEFVMHNITCVPGFWCLSQPQEEEKLADGWLVLLSHWPFHT